MNLFKRKPATIFYAILAFLLLADLAYSAYQHYHMPLGGDMAEVIRPAPGHGYDLVMHDPFGFKALLDHESYPNPNRFFAHWASSQYFLNVPLLLQQFTDPISSIYWSGALIKIFTQALLIFLLAVYISNSSSIMNKGFLTAAILVTPFFQASGFCRTLGIIDQSVIYTFFYAFPLALLMLFFLPFFKIIYYRNQMSIPRWMIVLMVGFMVVLSLNGPLIPGVVLIIVPIVLWVLWRRSLKEVQNDAGIGRKLRDSIRKMPRMLVFMLIIFALFCLYSLYLGSFNSLNEPGSLSLTERYANIPTGLYNLLTKKLAFPLLLIIIIINTVWIDRAHKTGEGRDILQLIRWFTVFMLLYILLLPLGGYRSYRENIVRYDTIMPVTLGLVFLFGKSSLFLFDRISGKYKTIYAFVIMAVLITFTAADSLNVKPYRCERDAVGQIASSPENVVRLTDNCPVLDWKIIATPEESKPTSALLQYWNITREPKLFYHTSLN